MLNGLHLYSAIQADTYTDVIAVDTFGCLFTSSVESLEAVGGLICPFKMEIWKMRGLHPIQDSKRQ